MSDTAKLGLPLIAAAQAQKHVTHNEALVALDTLVQLSALDKDLAAPPAEPAEGDTYIVGPSASGAWAGHAGDVARFQDGTWVFYAPKEGWLAWLTDEDRLYRYDGAAWGLAAVGDVVGPGSAAANEVPLFDEATGKLLKRPGTGHALLPSGTTAQRPGSPTAPGIRHNTSLSRWEYWTGSAWRQIPFEESGDWTPVLKGSTTPGSYSYAAQGGRWRRNGSLLYLDFRVDLSAVNEAGSGNILIGGIPFSALDVSRTAGQATSIANLAASPSNFAGWLVTVSSATDLQLRYWLSTNGGSTGMNIQTFIQSNSILRGFITYIVT